MTGESHPLICDKCKKKIGHVWNNGTSHIMFVECQTCFDAVLQNMEL